MFLEKMNRSIKEEWIVALISIALIAIITNSVLNSVLIDKYFIGYIGENYEKQIKEIQEYGQFILERDSIPIDQIEMELQKYLDDPIVGIAIYRQSGQRIVSTRAMGRGMGMGMMHRNSEERDEYDIQDGDKSIGKIIITRQGSIRSSESSRLFKEQLFNNSLISGGIVLLIAIIVSNLISRKTVKDLMNTAAYAKSLDLNEEMELQPSKIIEITEIQDSLFLLSTKLRLKEKLRKQKLDMMVHQARTPLTILKSQMEGAKDGIVTMDEQRLDGCLNQVDTLTGVISNFKEILEIDQETEALKIETFDLVEEMNKMIKGLKIQFEAKSIGLILHAKDSIIINTDKYLLTQGIYNILTNAYKFTPSGGEVELDVKNVEDYIILKIKDTGIGIPKGSISKIFDPYTRASNAMKTPGQGLGLFVLKNNLKRIGGKVQVESVEGVGTTFEIIIPK